jgi:hypothetical protein
MGAKSKRPGPKAPKPAPPAKAKLLPPRKGRIHRAKSRV